MNKYLFFLNWSMTAALILAWIFLRPIFGLAVCVGSFFGAMLSVGYISWQFHKDPDPDKNNSWKSFYFNKDYIVEIPVQLFLTAIFLFLASLLWRPFFAALGGFAFMWSVNILLEALWSAFFLKRH